MYKFKKQTLNFYSYKVHIKKLYLLFCYETKKISYNNDSKKILFRNVIFFSFSCCYVCIVC